LQVYEQAAESVSSRSNEAIRTRIHQLPKRDDPTGPRHVSALD
jgi:hypothetical protein